MADDRIRLPSSGAGLTRYFDEYHSKISFKPGHIIIFVIVVIVIIALLHMFGYSMLGLS
ncbi:preprotein translocase subunit Sec61beta [Candidatus Woesearchaeota archaeon]|nr:preprotein translocase subunit Sec61beta [Candidatus Woesearchaeota archaeon]